MRLASRAGLGAALLAAAVTSAGQADAASPGLPACRPIYLTFDTGHMGVAPLVAEVLRREQVKVTFFVANEPTLEGGTSLDDDWAPWWKERAQEGHAFGSHTWDHVVWQADTAGGWRMKATALPGQPVRVLDTAAYCRQLRQPAERFRTMTGQSMLAMFRAPAGRTSPRLLAAASKCGFTHVGWSPAGFLSDELPSDRHPNDALLKKALRDIRPGDILLAHLGIWSRQDAWAPAVLQPLIGGLKSRGFCFATLRDHPAYTAVAAVR